MTKSVYHKKITLATLWKQTNREARDCGQKIAMGVGGAKENGATAHWRWKEVGARGGECGRERELLLCTRQTLPLFLSVQTFHSVPADGLWKLLCGITI